MAFDGLYWIIYSPYNYTVLWSTSYYRCTSYKSNQFFSPWSAALITFNGDASNWVFLLHSLPFPLWSPLFQRSRHHGNWHENWMKIFLRKKLTIEPQTSQSNTWRIKPQDHGVLPQTVLLDKHPLYFWQFQFCQRL